MLCYAMQHTLSFSRSLTPEDFFFILILSISRSSSYSVGCLSCYSLPLLAAVDCFSIHLSFLVALILFSSSFHTRWIFSTLWPRSSEGRKNWNCCCSLYFLSLLLRWLLVYNKIINIMNYMGNIFFHVSSTKR